MNQQDLIHKLQEKFTGAVQPISVRGAKGILLCIEAIVSEALKNGETVTLPGIGTWSVKERAARSGRNPQTGEAIEIPAKRVVKFSPAKNLRDLLN